MKQYDRVIIIGDYTFVPKGTIGETNWETKKYPTGHRYLVWFNRGTENEQGWWMLPKVLRRHYDK